MSNTRIEREHADESACVDRSTDDITIVYFLFSIFSFIALRAFLTINAYKDAVRGAEGGARRPHGQMSLKRCR
jgi:hypothetical protein